MKTRKNFTAYCLFLRNQLRQKEIFLKRHFIHMQMQEK